MEWDKPTSWDQLPLWLSVKDDLPALFKCEQSTAYAWVKRVGLPLIPIPGGDCVSRWQLQRYIEQGGEEG